MWADLGSGAGVFTLATADLLPSGSKIYSIDQNSLSLQSQEAEFSRLFPDFPISFHTADFTHLPGPLTSSSLSSKSSSLRVEDLTLSPKGRGNVGGLNGILMANSLHFVKDKVPVLKKLKELLKPGGRIVFVEYNVDQGNHWVPSTLFLLKL